MSSNTLNLTSELLTYLRLHSVKETPVQVALREKTALMSEANMQVSSEQANFMQLLIKLIRAKKVIEIGTFTGYSSLAMALALPADGQIIACDSSEEWTAMAKQHWQQAGVADKIDLRLAPALETIDALINNGAANTFDFAFIDADKLNYDAYYELCLTLVKPNGLIAIDNVLWGGDVLQLEEPSASTLAICALNDKLYQDERIDMTMVPIGDGITLALKK